MDLRLIVAARRAFKTAPSVRVGAMVDDIRMTMGCSEPEARDHLETLELGRYVFVRGSGADRLVFPGPNLDTTQLWRLVADKVPPGR